MIDEKLLRKYGEITNDDLLNLIKKPLNFVKEYPTFCFFMITFLGGIWQTIQLGVISLSYIRFFSISQLLPDGLFVLFSLFLFTIFLIINFIFCSLLYSLTYSFFGEIAINKFINKLNNTKNVLNKTQINIILIFTILLIIYTFWIILSTNISFENHLKHVSIFCCLIYIIIYFYKVTRISLMHRFFFLLLISVMLTFVFVFFSFLNKFYDKYLYPKNLKNFDELLTKIKLENPKKLVEIIYFNDKYIFVEIINCKRNEVNNRQIEIIDFENLLQNEKATKP